MNTSFFYVMHCYMPQALPYWKRYSPFKAKQDPAKEETATAHRDERVLERDLGLEEGEWVEVKTEDEIRSTLDRQEQLGGLGFMPEQAKFCGERLRIFKHVKKIKLESTGEVRTISRPTFCLEGAFCDGLSHDDCDRSCLLLWREEWLRRA